MAELVEKSVKDLPKKCSVVSSSSSGKKEEIVDTHQLEDKFSSPTPVKTKEPPRIQSKDELLQLPEKYGALVEFFERMISSLRLLGLRKKTPNFQNVSSQVEILTGRKFLFSHLAQINYIFPEAVQIEKILVHDEKTKCMKSDMEISLLFDVVKDHNENSVFVALSKVFSSRLRDFIVTHPETSGVPEAALPEPFGQRRSITIEEDSISEPTLCETDVLNPSHLPPSFKKFFDEKAAAAEMEKTDIPSPGKSTCEDNGVVEKESSLPSSSSTANMSESTPMKPLAGSGSVLVGTPVQSTPVRPISPTKSVLTCEDENKMTGSQKGKQSTGTAKKSLDFYSVDGEDSISSGKQTSFCASDLVLLIHKIFQSVKFCPITKEELVQKILMNSFVFDNRSEVELQMENLEKIVPDWFFKKMAPSGDLLYNVNKVSDLDSVYERSNDI
ncbi:hypothetical protein ACS0TY_034371 [Phlomoides rotata]